jgi:ribosome-interacting GTPase 1
VPANLTQPYKDAEARYRAAATHEERHLALREMIALLPKHKGTEKLHADLKHRLSRLEEEGERTATSGKRRADPSHVKHEGAGQWVLLGPPNAGKSSLLAALTGAHPAIADYPFTTHVPLPGMMPFEDVQVQVVDAPPASPGHTEGWLPNLVHGADGVVLVVDVADDDLERDVGECLAVMRRARVWPAARALPPDGSPLAVRRPVVVAANKVDLDADGTFAAMAREVVGGDLPWLPVSARRGDGLEALRAALWRELRRIRVYTKEPGKRPDLARPFVLLEGATVHDLAMLVHREVADRLAFARLWGHVRFEGQQVDRHHVLADRDVVELHG